MYIELSCEQIDGIMEAGIQSALDGLRQAWHDRKTGVEEIGIFKHKKKKDLKEIARHIEALEIARGYFCP